MNFKIVSFPFLDGDVRHSPPYGAFFSQLICFASVRSSIDDFNKRNVFVTSKLLKQSIDIMNFVKLFQYFITYTQSLFLIKNTILI